MKRMCVVLWMVCTLAGLGLVAAVDVTARQDDAGEAVTGQFVGNYSLVSFQSFREDGEVVNLDYVARIMYDEHGNMSAIGMPRDLPERERNASGERVRAGFAYFGTFVVDVDKGTVVHHVLGSPMNPSVVGRDRVRYYELSGDLLKLSIKDENDRVTGTLTWRRY